MLIALPVGKQNKVKAVGGAGLADMWGPTFDAAPPSYVNYMIRLGRRGVVKACKELDSDE